jgi:hypothetical protein
LLLINSTGRPVLSVVEGMLAGRKAGTASPQYHNETQAGDGLGTFISANTASDGELYP